MTKILHCLLNIKKKLTGGSCDASSLEYNISSDWNIRDEVTSPNNDQIGGSDV